MNRRDCSTAQAVVLHAERNGHAGMEFFKMATAATDVRNASVTFEIRATLEFTIHCETVQSLT
jgi:hypothetical protein